MSPRKTIISPDCSHQVFEKLATKLSGQKVMLEIGSIKPLIDQGLMNKVYKAESDKGKIVIHIIAQNDEQRRQKVHEKIAYLSKLLSSYPDIPTAEVISAGFLPDGSSYLVQRMLPGKVLGKRVIRSRNIIDLYTPRNYGLYLKQISILLYRLHHIPMKGFGRMKVVNGGLSGAFSSWEQFIKKESGSWLDNIYEYRRTIDQSVLSARDYRLYRNQLKSLLDRNADSLSCATASLIHGDITNPGNILISNRKITGILDFEWALIGDPAWEFAFNGQDILPYYFQAARENGMVINKDEFKRKIRLYEVLWLLWGANVHVRGGDLKKILFQKFDKKLRKALI